MGASPTPLPAQAAKHGSDFGLCVRRASGGTPPLPKQPKSAALLERGGSMVTRGIRHTEGLRVRRGRETQRMGSLLDGEGVRGEQPDLTRGLRHAHRYFRHREGLRVQSGRETHSPSFGPPGCVAGGCYHASNPCRAKSGTAQLVVLPVSTVTRAGPVTQKSEFPANLSSMSTQRTAQQRHVHNRG